MTVCMRLRWAPQKPPGPRTFQSRTPKYTGHAWEAQGEMGPSGLCQTLEMQEGREKVGAEDPDLALPGVCVSAEPGEKAPSLWGWS